MRSILFWLSGFLPCRCIRDQQGAPHMERYYVGSLFRKGSLFRMGVYLHHFVDDDPARGLHNHPWRWAFSLILAGWYIEQRPDGFHARRWINLISVNTFHRVLMPCIGNPRPNRQRLDCWTLFVHGRRVKPWGTFLPVIADESLAASSDAASQATSNARPTR